MTLLTLTDLACDRGGLVVLEGLDLTLDQGQAMILICISHLIPHNDNELNNCTNLAGILVGGASRGDAPMWEWSAKLVAIIRVA